MAEPDDISLADILAGESGGSDGPEIIPLGTILIGGDGQPYEVVNIGKKGVEVVIPGSPGYGTFGDPRGLITLPANTYYTSGGQAISINTKGEILGSPRTLSEGERKALGIGPLGGGGGGGGGGGTVTGSRAPDPIGAANGLLMLYQQKILNEGMPRQQAMEEFKMMLDQMNAQLDNEQIAGQFAQNAAVYTNQGQADFDTNMLRQQEGQVDRDVAVAQEFGNRAQSMVRDFLPSFVPGLTGASLPGVGGGPIPIPQVNPDQIYGLAGLGQVRDITHQPTAPVPIPTPNITPFDPNMLPQIPQYTPPPIPPEIAGLFMAGASGFPGFIV